MLGNMLNDLAEAIRRWTEKNGLESCILGLKVTASFDRSESYTRVIDGQARCITPEVKPQNSSSRPSKRTVPATARAKDSYQRRGAAEK